MESQRFDRQDRGDHDELVERLRDGLGAILALDQLPVDEQEEDEEVGNVVEHDRGDHLARADARLEDAWNKCPRGAEEGTKRDDAEDGDRCWEPSATEDDGCDRAAEGAHHELPLTSDIENAGSEGDHHGEANEHQRHRCEERLSDRSEGLRPEHGIAASGDRLAELCRIAECAHQQ